VADPGVARREVVEGGVRELAVGLRVLHRLEFLHPLVVLLALRLHAGDGLALGAVELLPEHDVGVLEDGLHEREQVERVRLALGVDARQRVEEVERERVEEREVLLQPAGGAQVRPAVALDPVQLHQPGRPQGAQPLGRGAAVSRVEVLRPVRAGDELDEAPVPAAEPGGLRLEQVHEQREGRLEAALQRLRLLLAEPVEGAPVPVDVALLRRLLLHHLLPGGGLPASFLFSTTCSGACATT